MANFEITSGLIASPMKIVVYGPEGIGKSTFAAGFPNALFIDTEGSTKKLLVNRLPKPTSWEMLLEEVGYVVEHPTVCDTLVIDTIDWAEQLCLASVCATGGKTGIEDFGYGKGYVYEKEAFARLLHRLDDVIAVGVNVLLTAHAQLRKVEQPEEMGGYDHWELKLGAKTTAQIAPMLKEWSDLLLFANYKTVVVSTDKEGKHHKAQGGRRVMYTTHTPWWDAKNRDNLPDEMDFFHGPIVELLIPRDKLGDPNAAYIKKGEAMDRTLSTEERRQQSEEQRLQMLNQILEEQPAEQPPQPVQQPAPQQPVVDPNIPPALADLMKADGIRDAEIRAAVAGMGYYPADTPISSYASDFIDGAIIGSWEQLKQYILSQIRDNLPF